MRGYNKIDQQIHQLSQTITKFNCGFVAHRTDDVHTNLAFDPIGNRILGRWAESEAGRFIMAINLRDFKFEVFNDSWKEMFSVGIIGKTQFEIEQSIKDFLPRLRLDALRFLIPLHYEIPEYDFKTEPFLPWPETDLSYWSEQRAMGNDACQWLLNHLQLKSEIRIWPHHFDTGIYVEPTERVGLGFGLAMQDSLVGSPYYYFSAYSLIKDEVNFEVVENLRHGKWILQENWKGAVIEISEVNRESLSSFLREVTAWYLNH